MPLGVINGKVRIEDYDSEWPFLAEDIIQKLWSVLKDKALDIQHIGSTSIPRIKAKPIIDIAVAVEDIEVAEAYKEELAKIGLCYFGEVVPNQRMYYVSSPGADDHTYHIHFVIACSEDWENYVNMRDYLTANEMEARLYEKLKCELSEKYADNRIDYTKGKAAYINGILKRARAWRINGKRKNTDT